MWWFNVYRIGNEPPRLGWPHPTKEEAERVGKGKPGYIKTIPFTIHNWVPQPKKRNAQ